MQKMIMLQNEGEHYICYRIGCACGAHEHDVDLYAEQESPADPPQLMLSATCSTPYWDPTFDTPWLAWLNEPIKRLKVISQVLFRGYAEYNFDFILDEDNVSALRYALDQIENKFGSK